MFMVESLYFFLAESLRDFAYFIAQIDELLNVK